MAIRVGILRRRMSLRLLRGRPLAEFPRLDARQADAAQATSASEASASLAGRAAR